jgi:hypothetical protein
VGAVYELPSPSNTGKVFWNESPVLPQWAMQEKAFITLHPRGTPFYNNVNMPGRQMHGNLDNNNNNNNNNPITEKLWALTCNHKT